MAKYKAIITQRDGTRICLELSCREYHAKKLEYVFSRTLDRGVYSSADVVACDALQADEEKKSIDQKYNDFIWELKPKDDKKYLIGGKA